MRTKRRYKYSGKRIGLRKPPPTCCYTVPEEMDRPLSSMITKRQEQENIPKPSWPGSADTFHMDGYAGYNSLRPEVTLVGCLAHARRKYDETLSALPPSDRDKNVAAKIGLGYLNQLYAVERELKNASPEERYEERLKRSKPIMEAFSAWLHQMKNQVLPKRTFGQAVQYSLNQMDNLVNYLKNGRLEIDNNRNERSIKPFVIGRKNWLFSNTPKVAKASAIIYSTLKTAKENNLNPYHYLTYLFEQILIS